MLFLELAFIVIRQLSEYLGGEVGRAGHAESQPSHLQEESVGISLSVMKANLPEHLGDVHGDTYCMAPEAADDYG